MRAPGRLVLLGHPVFHSLSPAFQNAALRAAKIPLTYQALDVPPRELATVANDLMTQRTAGNITIPHKESFAELCGARTPLALHVGAVNTFWTDDGVLVGDNTDVHGFDAAARALLGRDAEGVKVAVIGAGGSAAAVVAASTSWPAARVAVWGRTLPRAVALAARFGANAEEFLIDAIRDADLVVNATPIGLAGDDVPLPVALLPRRAAVMDLVYRPGETAWVRLARARGLPACDGLPMLLEQGALAFTRWFGIEPDREAMRRAIERT